VTVILRWTTQAADHLAKLPPSVADRISTKMLWYTSQEDPFAFAKRLTHRSAMLFRFRVGAYRVVCKVEHGVVTVVVVIAVKHRRHVYDI
jgi:mRNA interferase RelE/StbE